MGLTIFFGFTILKYSFSVKSLLLTASCFKVVPFLSAALAILVALSYPILGVKAVTNIKEFSKSDLIFFVLAFIPLTQNFAKFFELSAIKSIDCKILWAINGLNTFNSN